MDEKGVAINSEIVMHTDDKNVALCNFDFELFINTFHSIELNLSLFWLVNYGTTSSGERKYTYLIIRAYAIRPFFGPHLVSLITREGGVEGITTVWVHSLTFLRRELFQFVDRLSFERSTFVYPHQNADCLIRLKSIRGFIQIPFESIREGLEVAAVRKNRSREKLNQLLNKNVQSLITLLSRELSISMKESVIEINSYVSTYCTDLLLKFST